MNTLPSPIVRLVEAFERLPGVGPKSAQRLAYHMLHAPREYIDSFAETLRAVKEKVRLCNRCFNVSDEELCVVCRDPGRETHCIVVVEGPLDVLAFNKTGYRGQYHVLHGVIAPLQHIGPEQLYIAQLLPRLEDGKVTELILATNPTIEGEATAVYIQRLVRGFAGLKVTRIARGLPVGANVEYTDEVTLRRAFEGRSVF